MIEPTIDIILFFGIGLIVGIFLLVILVGPDGRTFMRARTKKKPIAVVHWGDRRREFIAVDEVSPDGWELKKHHALFRVNNETVDLTPSNLRIADVYPDVGATMVSEHAILAGNLLADGVDNFAQAESTERTKANKMYKILGKSINWQSFRNFIPIYMDPRIINSASERKARAMMPSINPTNWGKDRIMAIGMVVVLVAIALVILQSVGLLNFGGGAAVPAPAGA